MRARLGLYILLWSLMTNLTLAKAEPLLWGHLKAGPFRVGFSSRWIVDESRSFDAILPDKTHFGTTKTPRPILVNEWYPAAMTQLSEATEVVQGSYLDIAPPSGPLRNLANALSQRARENIASEVIDADDLDSLTPQQQIALKRYLETRTASHRGAPFQAGQFPLVVYVQGYGSSFEDNTVLCEYLASHGYVVLNSAYQDEHLHMIGGMQIAGDDVQFLIHYGRDLPNVDRTKVALIGHSGGAQTVLAYQSRPGAMADAVVSLDTTEDYYYVDKYSHLKFVRQVDPEQLSVPILFAANPDAIFQLADSLKHSQRYYLTERDTDHDEFIAHGLSRVLMLEKPTIASVDEKYSFLCEGILSYLDFTLHLDPKALATWPAPGKMPDFQAKVVNIEDVPAGKTAPPPYAAGNTPPSPRQFRELVLAGKTDEALLLLQRFMRGAAWSPLYREEFNFSLADHLLEQNQPERANEVASLFKGIDPKVSLQALFTEWGGLYARSGASDYAIREYQLALKMNPEDKVARMGLDKLQPNSQP